ncbi:MAG: hypothetical protein HYX22_00045 [Candidatus Yanofskybacteria bacterium]|nr:hypothetical protein [Candidatus Yanofskybacteria bacterium]
MLRRIGQSIWSFMDSPWILLFFTIVFSVFSFVEFNRGHYGIMTIWIVLALVDGTRFYNRVVARQ